MVYFLLLVSLLAFFGDGQVAAATTTTTTIRSINITPMIKIASPIPINGKVPTPANVVRGKVVFSCTESDKPPLSIVVGTDCRPERNWWHHVAGQTCVFDRHSTSLPSPIGEKTFAVTIPENTEAVSLCVALISATQDDKNDTIIRKKIEAIDTIYFQSSSEEDPGETETNGLPILLNPSPQHSAVQRTTSVILFDSAPFIEKGTADEILVNIDGGVGPELEDVHLFFKLESEAQWKTHPVTPSTSSSSSRLFSFRETLSLNQVGTWLVEARGLEKVGEVEGDYRVIVTSNTIRVRVADIPQELSSPSNMMIRPLSALVVACCDEDAANSAMQLISNGDAEDSERQLSVPIFLLSLIAKNGESSWTCPSVPPAVVSPSRLLGYECRGVSTQQKSLFQVLGGEGGKWIEKQLEKRSFDYIVFVNNRPSVEFKSHRFSAGSAAAEKRNFLSLAAPHLYSGFSLENALKIMAKGGIQIAQPAFIFSSSFSSSAASVLQLREDPRSSFRKTNIIAFGSPVSIVKLDIWQSFLRDFVRKVARSAAAASVSSAADVASSASSALVDIGRIMCDTSCEKARKCQTCAVIDATPVFVTGDVDTILAVNPHVSAFKKALIYATLTDKDAAWRFEDLQRRIMEPPRQLQASLSFGDYFELWTVDKCLSPSSVGRFPEVHRQNEESEEDHLSFYGEQNFRIKAHHVVSTQTTLQEHLEFIKTARDLLGLNSMEWSFGDIGAGQGYLGAALLLDGAREVTLVEFDENYANSHEFLASVAPFSNIQIVTKKLRDVSQKFDVVAAFGLVPFLISCTESSASVANVVSKLAKVTSGVAVIEWIDPTDAWLRNSQIPLELHSSFSQQEFEASLSHFFRCWRILGKSAGPDRIDAARTVYAAFNDPKGCGASSTPLLVTSPNLLDNEEVQQSKPINLFLVHSFSISSLVALIENIESKIGQMAKIIVLSPENRASQLRDVLDSKLQSRASMNIAMIQDFSLYSVHRAAQHYLESEADDSTDNEVYVVVSTPSMTFLDQCPSDILALLRRILAMSDSIDVAVPAVQVRDLPSSSLLKATTIFGELIAYDHTSTVPFNKDYHPKFDVHSSLPNDIMAGMFRAKFDFSRQNEAIGVGVAHMPFGMRWKWLHYTADNVDDEFLRIAPSLLEQQLPDAHVFAVRVIEATRWKVDRVSPLMVPISGGSAITIFGRFRSESTFARASTYIPRICTFRFPSGQVIESFVSAFSESSVVCTTPCFEGDGAGGEVAVFVSAQRRQLKSDRNWPPVGHFLMMEPPLISPSLPVAVRLTCGELPLPPPWLSFDLCDPIAMGAISEPPATTSVHSSLTFLSLSLDPSFPLASLKASLDVISFSPILLEKMAVEGEFRGIEKLMEGAKNAIVQETSGRILIHGQARHNYTRYFSDMVEQQQKIQNVSSSNSSNREEEESSLFYSPLVTHLPQFSFSANYETHQYSFSSVSNEEVKQKLSDLSGFPVSLNPKDTFVFSRK